MNAGKVVKMALGDCSWSSIRGEGEKITSLLSTPWKVEGIILIEKEIKKTEFGV